MRRAIALVTLLLASVSIAWLFLTIGQNATAAPVTITPGTVTSTAYGCVNASGGFDYWEFRSPLPHPCHYSGETLASIPAIVLGEGASFPLSLTLPGGTTPVDLECTVTTVPGLACVAATG